MSQSEPPIRPAKIHCLKAWPKPFADVVEGRKTFEYRLADRDFAVGDCLVLQEYNPEYDSLTGEATAVRVTYILPGAQYGIPERYCIMSIEPWSRARQEDPEPTATDEALCGVQRSGQGRRL